MNNPPYETSGGLGERFQIQMLYYYFNIKGIKLLWFKYIKYLKVMVKWTTFVLISNNTTSINFFLNLISKIYKEM